MEIGQRILSLAKELFPICRSITGDGVRTTLKILNQLLPNLQTFDIPSGTSCFDWTVPQEWNINDAYILDPKGIKIVDFKKSNLHVVNYSEPINKKIPLEDLQKHLYSLPDYPDAIPYVTSYYSRRWGFCLSENQRKELIAGEYTVHIDSQLKDGVLNYAELFIPGDTKEEIFLSTYICHPSMANNELSGPTVTAFLADWIQSLPHRQYSYRIVFIPETIGSIAYLSKNYNHLKENVIAGFNISCVGDNRAYSYLPSRNGGTISDRIALHILKHQCEKFDTYSYLDRGSDERQYCSPGIDLPIASVMRSKYGTYPEYHTSKDDFTVVTAEGLQGGFEVLKSCLEGLEANKIYKAKHLCEPQLGKRGLYPTISYKGSADEVKNMMDLLAYTDGTRDLLSIAETISVNILELKPLAEKLRAADLLTIIT